MKRGILLFFYLGKVEITVQKFFWGLKFGVNKQGWPPEMKIVESRPIVSLGLIISSACNLVLNATVIQYLCLIPRFLICPNTCMGPHSEWSWASKLCLHPHVQLANVSWNVWSSSLPQGIHTVEPQSRQLYYSRPSLTEQGNLPTRKWHHAETELEKSGTELYETQSVIPKSIDESTLREFITIMHTNFSFNIFF